MVELGLPGLLIVLWLLAAFIRYILRCLMLSAQQFVSPRLLILVLGSAIFLLVNVMTFSVATQAYGDIFILLMLGLVSGFIFSLPRLVVENIKATKSNTYLQYSS